MHKLYLLQNLVIYYTYAIKIIIIWFDKHFDF